MPKMTDGERLKRREYLERFWERYWRAQRKYKREELVKGVRVRNVVSQRVGVVTGHGRRNKYFVHVEVEGKKSRLARKRFVNWYIPNVGVYNKLKK